MEVNGQGYATATLTSGKGLRYPLGKRLGGPSAGLDAVKKRKISYSSHEWNTDSSVVQHPA
jgi:hypothetical protein